MRFLFVLMLSGCAVAPTPSGISMTETERQACAAQGCSVWTEAELTHLLHVAMSRARETCNRRDI